LTDFIQITIGSIGVLAAFIVSLHMIGGFGELIESLGRVSTSMNLGVNYMDPLSPGLTLIALSLVATTMYTLIGQDFYQRLLAARDPGVARKASILSGVLLMVLAFIPPLTGMCALALSNNPVEIIDSPKTAIPRLVLTLFPPVIGGFFVAALLAAIMSTADSLLSAAVSHIVRDLYQQLVNPEADQKTLMRLSIVSTIAIGVAALVSALTVKDIILLLIYSYDVYTSAVFVPVIMGIYWRRASRAGALTALIVGAGVTISGILGVVKLPYWELLYVGSAALAALAMVIVSLVKGPTEPSIELKRALGW
ncbi:MAG: sodium:solute symporter family protein, partial [Thermoprotei archaeon]